MSAKRNGTQSQTFLLITGLGSDMTHNTPMKHRMVRCIATGKVTSQSSNKTKRLLKLGGYVEVAPGGEGRGHIQITNQRASVSRSRRLWIGSGVALAVVMIAVWMRLVNFI